MPKRPAAASELAHALFGVVMSVDALQALLRDPSWVLTDEEATAVAAVVLWVQEALALPLDLPSGL